MSEMGIYRQLLHGSSFPHTNYETPSYRQSDCGDYPKNE
jgi:hypothetical protein